jgi:hypothetical protein
MEHGSHGYGGSEQGLERVYGPQIALMAGIRTMERR